jgi:hypothetical protein
VKRCATLLLVAHATLAAGCAGHSLYVRPGIDAACAACAADARALDSRFILIGDAGEPEANNPALALMAGVVGVAPERTLAIFLGDNIYPRGMPAPDETDADVERAAAEAILELQIRAASAAGIAAVFVPGNHDWDGSGARGLERVQAQAAFLAAAPQGNVVLQPAAGCPGPVVVDRGATARLIAIDSEWLLRADHPKLSACSWGAPGAEAPLPSPDAAGFYAALEQAVKGAGSRRVLLATHHPLRTRGSHGGYFTARQFLFPLTELASWLYLPLPVIYPLVRYSVVRSDQDLHGGRNQAMVQRIEAVLRGASRAPITAAGHEHSLQIFDDPASAMWYLVSGSGAKTEPTGATARTMFKHAARGLMVVDFFSDGRVSVRVVEPADGGREVFAHWLVE